MGHIHLVTANIIRVAISNPDLQNEIETCEDWKNYVENDYCNMYSDSVSNSNSNYDYSEEDKTCEQKIVNLFFFEYFNSFT